jgi:hypothetical protein
MSIMTKRQQLFAGADPVVMYTTLDEAFVTRDSQEEISASLLLAKVMGAVISSNLDSSITHILCDLNQDCIEWNIFISSGAFRNEKCGANLCLLMKDKLSETKSCHKVWLISPRWIRSKWTEET